MQRDLKRDLTGIMITAHRHYREVGILRKALEDIRDGKDAPCYLVAKALHEVFGEPDPNANQPKKDKDND